MQEEQKAQKLFHNIILRIKIHKRLKKWRKFAKKSKQRLFILKQWKETEINYLDKLVSLRDNVRNPLIQSGMIDEAEELILFPYIQSMISLGEEMKSQIDALIEVWNPISTRLASTVNKLIHYLKIYKDYSNNYLKGDAIVQQLKKSPKFSKVVTVHNIQDLFSKPFQRPLQYKLFITSYLKEMRQTHIDYEDLKKALQTLQAIANSINEHVEAQLNKQKLYKLESMFGGIIQGSSRSYISQFIASNIDIQCKIYVFNDMLFISRVINDRKQERYMKIDLSPNSFVVHKKEIKTYPNTLFICGKSSNIHLSFSCPTDLNSAYELLSETIMELYQKHYSRQEMISQISSSFKKTIKKPSQFEWKDLFEYNINLRITVVGLINRVYPPNNQKMIFVLKIQLGKPLQVFQLAYYDLEQLKQLQKDFQLLYPEITIPNIESRFKYTGFQQYKADIQRFYDHKSLIFESSLNHIIRSKPIVTRPQLFLYKLQLHQSVWKFLERNSFGQCFCDACLDSQIFKDFSFYEKEKASIFNYNYKFCEKKAYRAQKSIKQCVTPKQLREASIQMKLVWADCFNNHLEEDFQPRYDFGRRFNFKVYLNQDNDEISISLNASTQDTVRKVIEQICMKKGIRTSRDLRLALVYQKRNYYIHNEEYIYNIAKYIIKKEDSEVQRESKRSSIFSVFKRTQTYQSLILQDQPRLVLRKFFVFSSSLEQITCLDNPERFPMILGQILYRFKNELLPLSVGDLKILCAFAYSIQEFSTLSMSKKVYLNEQKMKKFFPENKKNFVSNHVLQELTQIIENQMKICDQVTSLYRCVMKHIGNKAGWKCQYFGIINLFPSSLIGGQMNLLLGVSHEKITISMFNINEILLELRLQDLKYTCNGDILTIETEIRTYLFKCENINLFETLVKKYKTICQFENKE